MDILEVKTEKDLQDFINLPWKIYKNYPHWVPPLKTEVKETLSRGKNPFFRHSEAAYFLVKDEKEVLGRIAAINNRNHNSYHDEKTGFFGFFETVENYDVTKLLFEAAAKWCKEKGLDVLRGPMSFSTNDECGLLIEGFDDAPAIVMPYNPPYYMGFMEKYGFRKKKDLLAFSHDLRPPSERVLQLLGRLKKKEITIRAARTWDFEKEMLNFQDIYNSAWGANWGFIPMTPDEVKYFARKIKPLVNPKIVIIAEISGKLAGGILAFPDYNQVLRHLDGKAGPLEMIKFLWYKNKITRARLITLGVKKEYRNLGVELLLTNEYWERTKELKLSSEFSWILEDNLHTRKLIEEWGGILYKRYRIYEMPLTDGNT